jgi:hypothetical protein
MWSFNDGYYDRVIFRILLGLSWLICLSAVLGVFALPATFDIYYYDRYMVVTRAHAIVVIVLLFVLPLLAVTTWYFRSRTHSPQ